MILYDLDNIMDEDTSESERDELQQALCYQAQENVNAGYGDINGNKIVDEKDSGSNGINMDIDKVYHTENIQKF